MAPIRGIILNKNVKSYTLIPNGNDYLLNVEHIAGFKASNIPLTKLEVSYLKKISFFQNWDDILPSEVRLIIDEVTKIIYVSDGWSTSADHLF